MKIIFKVPFILILFFFSFIPSSFAVPVNTSPPKKTVKIVFIHHSVGENWLSDDQGRLGKALGRNNYYVSDTNYGWGPDNIGDRTDILNWPEWFTGKKSKQYLKALYRLSSRHSSYSRKLKNPGGENTVVMFKSCFPNSQLGGRPNDRPKRGHDLTVANAKAIYNKLLTYFRKRPDKLFIAITAPPVLDRTRSNNARAFNSWLVNDWLKKYKGSNVAVFDFYNILTGPKNHHWVQKGKIEHVLEKGRNTLHYPSGGSDEHPSIKGSRKATFEFLPILNAYYHAWRNNQKYHKPIARRFKGESIPQKRTDTDTQSKRSRQKAKVVPEGNVIDNFEDGRCEWVIFSDTGNSKTQLEYKIKKAKFFKGTKGLEIKYQVAQDSWATCSMVLPKPQDWKSKKGISLLFKSERIGQKVAFVVYQGESPDNLRHFEYHLKGSKGNIGKWQRISITWNRLRQPPWEGDGKAKFNPRQSMGIAFAFNESKGKIWVDEICFLK